MVFVEHGGHDVGTSRAAVVQEHHGQCRSRNHTSDDQRHKVIALAQELVEVSVGHHHHLLGHFQHEREHEGGIDGLGEKFPSQDFDGSDNQQGVDDEEGILYGKAGGIEDDGSDTCYTSRHNLVGQQKDGESEGIHQQPEGDVEVVLDFIDDRFVHRCRNKFLPYPFPCGLWQRRSKNR